MKLKITKTLKAILLVINVILIIGVVIYFYRYYTSPHSIEETIVKYSYIQKGDIKYQVQLIPNDLYEERSIDEGSIYITQLIDCIKVSCNYNFEGDKSADIKGDYEIAAVVEGYVGEKDSVKTIWKKKFPIIPRTTIEAQKEGISIDKEVLFKLDEYREFARVIIEILKVNTNAKLCIQMNVNLKADIDKISVQEKMSPAIEIPLNVNYFTISKLNIAEKPGKVEETNRVKVPPDKKIIILCGIIIGILIISLLYLIIFTTEPTIKDKDIKNFNKIFKNHGNRLVALSNKFVTANQRCCRVKSIDDLVRIADELGKPIFYEHSRNFVEITRFFVFDDTWLYILDIKDSTYNEVIKEPDKGLI
ncbi:MAG TPA: DUF5305 family protein [Clostridiales bacterium]|nr:DUF5305 family protein [Clostridiales bacterium]